MTLSVNIGRLASCALLNCFRYCMLLREGNNFVATVD